MTSPESDSPAFFVTFYSFKGGVGRSMALINVAGILAGRGFRVLAIDMDLEAPGISFLMQQELANQAVQPPGFVDLLADAVENGVKSDLFSLPPSDVVARYSYAYTIPKEMQQSDEGYLRIMPAGRLDRDDYQSRLDGLSLRDLYREGHGQALIGAFKETLRDSQQFDFVLIDSRTGFSDEAGVCTRDLADALVVVMGLNRQNLQGTSRFLASLRAAGVKKPLRVVLSPVPNGEEELMEKREAEASQALAKAYGAPISFELQIPYHPRLALTEEPYVFRRSRGYVYEAYARVEIAVLRLAGLSFPNLQRAIRAAGRSRDVGSIIKLSRTLLKVDRGSGALDALVSRSLSELSLDPEAGELREFLAKSLSPTSQTFVRLALDLAKKGSSDAGLFFERAVAAEPEDAWLLACHAHFVGSVLSDLSKAQELFERAILVESDNAAVLGAFALFLTDRRPDYPRAAHLFAEALAIEPENANQQGNFAKLLFLIGRTDEARARLDAAVEHAATVELLCELRFYAYAHLWQQDPLSLFSIAPLLRSGACSKGWPLQENVRVAIESGHPAPDFLRALAKVVSGEAGVDTLDVFPEWQSATLRAPSRVTPPT